MTAQFEVDGDRDVRPGRRVAVDGQKPAARSAHAGQDDLRGHREDGRNDAQNFDEELGIPHVDVVTEEVLPPGLLFHLEVCYCDMCALLNNLCRFIDKTPWGLCAWPGLTTSTAGSI